MPRTSLFFNNERIMAVFRRSIASWGSLGEGGSISTLSVGVVRRARRQACNGVKFGSLHNAITDRGVRGGFRSSVGDHAIPLALLVDGEQGAATMTAMTEVNTPISNKEGSNARSTNLVTNCQLSFLRQPFQVSSMTKPCAWASCLTITIILVQSQE
jgi:hypothetical protein